MRTSYGFLAAIGMTAAFLLFIFALVSLEPQVDTATNHSTNRDLSPLTTPTVSFGNPSKGSRSAPVTIVEFGDFQCEPCKTVGAVIDQIVTERPDDVRLVWKDLPNVTSHPLSRKAAEAARCADEQGAFWEYHRLLFVDQTGITETALPVYASTLGLDEEKFTECLSSARTSPLVERDVIEALRLGLDATPYIFINGRRVSGAIGADAVNTIINEEKAAATAK